MHLCSRINVWILITSCCCTAPHCETLQVLTRGKEETTLMTKKMKTCNNSKAKTKENQIFLLVQKRALRPRQEDVLHHNMSLPRMLQEKIKHKEKDSNTISKIINILPCNDMQELRSEDCLLWLLWILVSRNQFYYLPNRVEISNMRQREKAKETE